jgi:protein required for attachment to host cells
MRNTRIWILITDGVSARICSTSEGTTTSITAPTETRLGMIGGPTSQTMDEAWYLRGGRNSLMRGATAHFTDYIAQMLEEAATERAFDGLAIIAAPHIASEVEHALSQHTRALMIGGVVQDLPAIVHPEPAPRTDLWH